MIFVFVKVIIYLELLCREVFLLTENKIYEALEKLTACGGTSGYEKDAATVSENILSEYMNTCTDNMGNVIGALNEEGKIKVLLDAHLDRIGLVVKGIDEKGFLLVEKVGGLDERVLTGAEVTVYGKKALTGVICSTPPHLLSVEDEKKGVDVSKIAIDIGFARKEAEELVSIGDRAIIKSEFTRLLGSRVAAGALDNRCGVLSLILAAEKLCKRLKNVSLTILLSSQEETYGSGAKCGAYSTDADYAIAVDVGFGGDCYTEKSLTVALGKGPSIGIAPVLDRGLTLKLKEIAEKENIPYQHDVMSRTTGTNADHICITKGGIKTALLSIPLKYMHTPVEVIDIKDVEYTAALIEKFILTLEENANA